MRLRVLSLLLFSISTCVFAQAPYLVKDLGNAGGHPQPQSSHPTAFLSSGSALFFTATTDINGREPWVYDANGARLLRDINSGPAESGVLRFVEVTPGVVVFAANDGVHSTQLWRSDGTEAGTVLLKAVHTSASSFNSAFGHGGKVFFFAHDGAHGFEPWVTDGTSEGTRLLVDARPGPDGTAGQFFRFGNTTRFLSFGGMWTTDGTPGGTGLKIPLAGFRAPAVVSGNTIYFIGYDAEHGYEPWKSDGTPAGTAMLRDIRSGTAHLGTTASMTPTASGAVFFADDGTGIRLWTTDGTGANTYALASFSPATPLTSHPSLMPAPQGVFFVIESNIWRTDGTEAGTWVSTTTSSTPLRFIPAFSKIYFSSWYGTDQRLFQFDGSRGATVVDVRPEVGVRNVTFTGGKLWFTGTDTTNGSELWVSDDGTGTAMRLVANLALDPARSSSPVNLTPAGPHLYFHPTQPRELWRSDGTSGGTIEVTDIDNTLSSPGPFESLTPYRGDVYYLHGHSELFRVDGVNGGASKVGDYNFDAMTADENYLYLWNYGTPAVHRSDGTAAGTIRLYDRNDPSHLTDKYETLSLVTHGGYAWIRCFHGIFRTAGTVETTQRVVSLPDPSYFWGEYATAGGLLYSPVFTQANGAELWRSDGTGGGSFVVKDAYPGPASSEPSSLTPAGRLLFFTAHDPEHGRELWRTDGTTAGTFMVKDIRAGTESSGPSALTALGEVLYFAANDGTNGVELWKSDGTAAGTVLVRDIAPGLFSSKPSALAAAGGKIWFSANDGLHGAELWSTDGTEAGTGMAGDIIPGSSSSTPDQLTAAESTLFFTAATDVEGRELWAMPLTTGYISVTGSRTTEGNSGTRTLRFTITRHGAAGGAASVAWAALPGTATAGVDYTAANGTIGFAIGERVKTVDITIHGDTASEPNETVTLQLSSASGAVLQDAIASGVIDDDDPRVDLGAEIIQTATDSGEASRTIRVFNNGPSSATGITVTFTESPYDFPVSGYVPSGDIQCSSTVSSTIRCTLGFLQPGDSRLIYLQRWPVKGLVDPAMPPGRTMTVNVTSASADTNVANNTVSRMTTGNGMLLLPAKLVVGAPATVTFDLGAVASTATDVTLTSSSASVVPAPAIARIEAGQRTATFTLTTGPGAARTLLKAVIASEVKAALVVPVAANASQSPPLDVAIAAETKSPLAYGELFVIPVRVAARYADGTTPSGLVTLLDENGTALSQLTLDTEGATTFTRPQPAPGDYHYRVQYSGDGKFNPVTVALPKITIQKATTGVAVRAPSLTCANNVEVRVVVSAPEGTPAPTGTVSLWLANGPINAPALGTWPLTPTGPRQSEVTATVTVPDGYQYLRASYSGDGYFGISDGRKELIVGCTAMNVVATATSATTVALSWTQPAQTTNRYAVYRASSIDGQFLLVLTSYSVSAIDTTAQPGRVYVYFVSTFGGGGMPSLNSQPEIASTFTWTDNPLSPGLRIKSVHLTELRAMVAALRNAAALPALAFTGSVAPGSKVDARHVIELRTSIDAARARIGVAPAQWTQPNAQRGALIRAATVQELRAGAQ